MSKTGCQRFYLLVYLLCTMNSSYFLVLFYKISNCDIFSFFFNISFLLSFLRLSLSSSSFFLSLVSTSYFFLTLLFWAAGMAIVNQAIGRQSSPYLLFEDAWNFMKFPAKYFAQNVKKIRFSLEGQSLAFSRFTVLKTIENILNHLKSCFKMLESSSFLFRILLSFTRAFTYEITLKMNQ